MTGRESVAPPFPPDLPVPLRVIAILECLEAAGFETWCVGGAIRDLLLHGEQQDVDLATAATPAEVQRLFPRTAPVGIDHGTVGVIDDMRVMHEVTTFRRDVRTDGRRAIVEFGVSLEDDLARRDFTINAIAYHPLRSEWRDPFDGRLDLHARIIRAVGDPAARLTEDRLRILRALRFAARLDFSIEPETWRAVIAQAPDTAHLSAERVRDEWIKGIATARDVSTLVRLWHESGVAATWLPECVACAVPDALRDPVLITAVCCRLSAPVWRRFKGSTAEIRRAEALDRGPAAPASADAREVRRWMAIVGAAADDLAAVARWRSADDDDWTAVMSAIRSRGEATERSALAVTGADLTAIGIAPGPAMGRTFERLLAAVVDRPEPNSRDQLIALARDPA